jgi:iron complex transport system substrate-binding protein
VLLIRGQEAKTAEEFQNTVVSFMESHDVASQLTAVQNGDVYRAGPLYQGPITNLVVTERLARTLYGVEEELFDRERVADIVAGDV